MHTHIGPSPATQADGKFCMHHSVISRMPPTTGTPLADLPSPSQSTIKTQGGRPSIWQATTIALALRLPN